MSMLLVDNRIDKLPISFLSSYVTKRAGFWSGDAFLEKSAMTLLVLMTVLTTRSQKKKKKKN